MDIIAIGDVYRYIKFKQKNIKKNMVQFRNGKYYILLFITNNWRKFNIHDYYDVI